MRMQHARLEQTRRHCAAQISVALSPSEKTVDAVETHDAMSEREYAVRIMTLDKVNWKGLSEIGQKQPLEHYVQRRSYGSGLYLRRAAERSFLLCNGLLQRPQYSRKIDRDQQQVENVDMVEISPAVTCKPQIAPVKCIIRGGRKWQPYT